MIFMHDYSRKQLLTGAALLTLAVAYLLLAWAFPDVATPVALAVIAGVLVYYGRCLSAIVQHRRDQ